MWNGRSCVVVLALMALGAGSVISAEASDGAPELQPAALMRAKLIRAEVNARYRRARGRKLVVTEPSRTGVLESFTLLGPDDVRVVSAANGVWFAICAARARCPFPGRRLARPAADYVPRRLALELAVRTFTETSADLVAVGLPTPRFTFLVVERADLVGHLPALAGAFRGVQPTSRLQLVDQLTRPRVFVGAGLESTPTGGDTLVAYLRWSVANPERSTK
jgi:hypothetical protein